jgi:hypothetical protein
MINRLLDAIVKHMKILLRQIQHRRARFVEHRDRSDHLLGMHLNFILRLTRRLRRNRGRSRLRLRANRQQRKTRDNCPAEPAVPAEFDQSPHSAAGCDSIPWLAVALDSRRSFGGVIIPP